MPKKDDDFEVSFEKLKEISEKIKDPDTKLNDAIKLYEEGVEYYRKCDGILKKAEQKIETIEVN